uniref:non-ribosomal peptide synthetase n=1 Tax=Streptomyces apocyni TaxID=2654677 RepID=UPI0012E9A657
AYPMAELQLGMVYEMERDPDRNPYLNVESLPMAGRFDAVAFRRALALVTERHAVLRTSLALTGYSEPTQLVHTAVTLPLTVVDLRGLSDIEQSATLRECVSAERAKPFDVRTAPLCRMSVHVLSDDSFQWTVTDHHAILDGWSLASTLAEITDTYHALLRGEDVTLPPLRSTYRDYIAAERTALTSAESAAYWHTLLAGHPRDPLPWRSAETEFRPAGDQLDGETHLRDEEQGYGVLNTPLSEKLLASLKEFATAAGVPFKSVVLAAHLRAMTLVTGSTDVVTGLTSNGRLEETDGSEARGLFLNTVPFRMRMPEGSWTDLARAVFEAEREMLPHRRYPMSALQRGLGGGALFDVNFTYNDFSQLGTLAQSGAFAPEGPGADIQGVAITNFPFSVTISREAVLGGLRMEFEYDIRELTAAQVTRIRDYHLRALTAMAADCDTDHRGAELMSEREQELLAAWHDSGVSAPSLPVHELLRRQARRTPDTVAVEDGGTRLSFADLDAHSEVLARRLCQRGVRRGDLVGICLRPGATALVTLWAVWKAGAAFVPLDPDLPERRLSLMLEQASPVLIVTDVPREVPEGYVVFDPTAPAPAPAPALGAEPEDEATPLPDVDDHDLAYVMFTSGTTGRPKGVMIEHGSLSEYAVGTLAARTRSLGSTGPLRVVTGSSAYISDFFIEQVLLVLEGHTLCVLGQEERRDLRHLVERAHDERRAADIVDTTTLQMQVLVEHGLLDAPHPPRLVVFGGEACPPDLWDRLAAYPAVRAVNSYGPTEATVEATLAEVMEGTTPVIGRPRPGMRVHLLDDAGNLVPPGTVGEIYLGGPGIGRGYLELPALTAERFLPDAWNLAGSRLYRTGDLGRLTESGELEYLGRADHQLKVLGQRVEPEEIEAVLRTHPGVAAAVVGLRPGYDGLLANIVAVDGAPVDQRELRRHAAAQLPAAAVPRFFVVVEALPHTVVGKLDRGALRAPEESVPPQRGDTRSVARPAERTTRDAELLRVTDTAGYDPAPTEHRVSAAWEKVLGLRVSRDDDFFLVGGHSLLALRLVGELSAAFDTTVPLAQLYDTPTVAGQAEYLDRRLGTAGARQAHGGGRRVVSLGGTTGARPLVLVHPLGGTLFCYLDLVARVSDSFEILGVQADLLGGGGTSDFAATAQGYADELAPLLEGRRPVIAGWSAGGVLAQEVAVRLSVLGVVPERVVLVDAAPGQDPEDAEDGLALERLRADVARRGLPQVLADGAADGLLKLLGVDSAGLAQLSGPVADSLMEFWQGMLSGLTRHRPSVFDGPVHLVLSRHGADEARRTAVAGWQRLARELRVSLADGDHYQLIRDPWVTAVADAIVHATDTKGV